MKRPLIPFDKLRRDPPGVEAAPKAQALRAVLCDSISVVMVLRARLNSLIEVCEAFTTSCPCHLPHVVSIKPRKVGVELCENCVRAKAAIEEARNAIGEARQA